VENVPGGIAAFAAYLTEFKAEDLAEDLAAS
jgi:hypothetical protein